MPVSLCQRQSVATVSAHPLRRTEVLLIDDDRSRYPALRCFLEKYKFPMGTMNLRRFSWSLEFFHPADTYKIEMISKIIDSYPLRKYIFVGDSGELDPEIYSKLYVKYPQAIAHIFIRDVCHTPTCLPTCEERYAKAFDGVPKERWTVFKDPTKLEADVNKLLSV